jgi:hypothetical protein
MLISSSFAWLPWRGLHAFQLRFTAHVWPARRRPSDFIRIAVSRPERRGRRGDAPNRLKPANVPLFVASNTPKRFG